MRIILGFTTICFLLSACTGEEAASPIQLAEDEPAELLVEAESDKTNPEENDLEEFIEFTVDEEVISLSIHEIPILEQYLLVQQNPQLKIAEMKLEKYEYGLQDFFLLRFSCHKEHCSYLLLHPDENKPAFLIADMAQLETLSLSPDGMKAAFHFNRMREQRLPVGNVVVFNLDAWSPTKITAEADETQDSDRLHFTWPIITMEWVNNNSISISFPDLIEPTKDSWEVWSTTEENAKHTFIYDLPTN